VAGFSMRIQIVLTEEAPQDVFPTFPAPLTELLKSHFVRNEITKVDLYSFFTLISDETGESFLLYSLFVIF
jgi:hypothetical protein